MPASPSTRPLITEASRKDAPEATPTSPLARGRRSGPTMSETSAGRLTLLTLPNITEIITHPTRDHRAGLVERKGVGPDVAA